MAGKYRRKRTTKHKKSKRQKGGLLNRYDFAYAGRDTVNQVFKNLNATTPGLIKDLSN